ncbi:hypothetical protein V6N11_051128 [Hibiscus sabdariffa]|uniref:Uncharacterized protein n=1 Tax=Hibiscus sabdariffa TaxID=183260 RepID=A0ABR2R3C0_9ROSI
MHQGDEHVDGQHDQPVGGNSGALARPRAIRQFGGSPHEDARQHIRAFLEVCDSFRQQGVHEDVVMFYNGVNGPTRMMLDDSGNGTLLDKSPEEAFEILDKITNNDYQFPTSRLGSGRRTSGKLELEANDSVSA